MTDPKARHEAGPSDARGRPSPDTHRRPATPDAPSPGPSDRPGTDEPAADRTAATRPVAGTPAPDRPVADRPVTDGPPGHRPEDGGEADALPGHDTRGRAADLDAARAEIADLKDRLADRDGKLDAAQARIADLEARLADPDTWSADLRTPVTNRDAKPDAANAEITELRAELDNAYATIAEQGADIAALKEASETQGGMVRDLAKRMRRLENAGADSPAPVVDQREISQQDTHAAQDAGHGDEDEKLDGRYRGDDAQLADTQKPSWYERGPVDSTWTTPISMTRSVLDRHISATESDALVDAACDLGLDRRAVEGLHRGYLNALARAAWDDGIVTDDAPSRLRTG